MGKKNKLLSDILFILWAGGAALLSYSLVYALRKPFTAAEFNGLTVCGMDYKIAVTVVQILGYLLAKFAGIKVISELRREARLGFILFSVGIAEMALVFFVVLPVPWNVLAMFFNGLALGCMWGVIFSFIEGRRVTDLLASLLGISMVVSSGTAKSVGLYVMNHFHVDEFWMPAVIGACALLVLLGLVMAGMVTMAYVSIRYEELQLDPLLWLFIQSLCLYIGFLTFQTIFFDRFIACFRIRGNVGFFIVLIDFIGYSGTVVVLTVKEFFSPEIEWLPFYNRLAGFVGIACCLLFSGAFVYLLRRHRREAPAPVVETTPAGLPVSML